MGWVAIPQDLGDSPKLIELGHEARSRLVALWCYCGRHENDGEMSFAVAETIVPPTILRALADAGFLTIESGRVKVVGFLEINLTHSKREYNRNKAKERKDRFLGARDGKKKERRSERRSNKRSERDKTGTGTDTDMETATETEEDHSSAPTGLPASASPSQEGSTAITTPISETGFDVVSRAFSLAADTSKKKTPSQEVWDFYRVRFAIAYGVDPQAQQHYFVQLAKITKSGQSVDAICQRIDVYFDSPPWKLREGSRDFGRFLANFDQLAGSETRASCRKYEFQEAASKWLANSNGRAASIPERLRKLATQTELPY